MSVKHLRNMADYESVRRSTPDTTLIVADFTAGWCGPCKVMAPYFARLAKENTDVVFVSVDVDEMEELATHMGIQAMPTFQFYKGGRKVDEMKGANKEVLAAKIQKCR